jgi:hypothetical protein
VSDRRYCFSSVQSVRPLTGSARRGETLKVMLRRANVAPCLMPARRRHAGKGRGAPFHQERLAVRLLEAPRTVDVDPPPEGV